MVYLFHKNVVSDGNCSTAVTSLVREVAAVREALLSVTDASGFLSMENGKFKMENYFKIFKSCISSILNIS